ncbi:50S ribosomal protein L9 [Patescibacteria group bacterium]|nr:50S ribosomal protein L9 [Patescibacteria group bacterium]MBU1015775.1 50S ribosomal protein L9 [Patescibacteria group bacterium]MBU1685183.1 50S ribosomal protein L9 [Patescibacteria group bacterium]MBU1938319.1 50S ribosomal protein L9 [Patescibacteria group bacterium]
MKVILKTRVPNLGHEWDIVTVKDGYARNYLLPKKLADVATPKLIELAQKRMEERVKKMEELVATAKETAEKLAKIELIFKKKARGGKLYGSISEKDIQAALKKEHKLEVDKGAINMKEHIKELGEHKATIHLAEGVDASIKISIEEEK